MRMSRRARVYAKRVKRSIRKKIKKRKVASTPSSSRGRIQEVTPPSTGRRLFGTAVNAAAGAASISNPYLGLGIEAAGGVGEAAYDYLTSVPRKSYGGGAPYGGVGYAKPKGFFKKKGKKNPSIAQIQKRGITLSFENRKIATVTDAEAVAVGHTSMPGKICAINMWRALLKYTLTKMSCYVKDYGNLMTNEGFVAGDVFRINRYANGTTTTISSENITVAATTTYDRICADLAATFDDNPNLTDDRLDSIEFVPFTGSKYSAVNLDIQSIKISVFTKSILKIQNTTVEVSTDNQADDVNRVPLVGKIYGVRGNNFLRKSNTALLSGLYSANNEEAIFAGWTKAVSNVLTLTSVGYYEASAGPANNNQTTFFKPSEPPRQYELQNCVSMSNINVSPGEIKSSTLVQKYTFGLQYYFNLLYSTRNTDNNLLVYNPKQGKTNVMYLEKVVGRAATTQNAVTLWTELEFRQSVLCHGVGIDMTLPIQYQADFV